MGDGPNGSPVDLDVLGAVRVRLLDADEADVAAVRRQLGVAPSTPVGDADIVVRLVDRIPTSGLRSLGAGSTAYTDHHFLYRRHAPAALAAIPMDRIGGPCEIICERRWGGVPDLVAIVNLTLLHRDVLPLHAAAARIGGFGVAAAGWSKGGKTEALLALVARGADPIADEWTYLGPQPGRMRGLPGPIRILDWHLGRFPGLAGLHWGITGARRARMRAASGLAGLRSTAARVPIRPVRRFLELGLDVAEEQRSSEVPPEALAPNWLAEATLDRAYLLTRRPSGPVAVAPIGSGELVDAMVAAHQHHRLNLLRGYLEFRHAFPGAVNPWLEGAGEREQALAQRLLADTPAWRVTLSLPVDFRQLFDALDPAASADPPGSVAPKVP